MYFLFTVPAVVVRDFTGQQILYLAMIKIPFVISDVVTAYYVFRILTFFVSERRALKFTSLYAFNPLVIFESSGGGFNDPIVIALTVASLHYLLTYRETKSGTSPPQASLEKSAVLMGLGIATKFYPLLLVPVFLREIKTLRDRVIYLSLALVPILFFSLPFLVWDFQSYLDLLAFRNVGGVHPLFPTLALPGYAATISIGALALVLLSIYLTSFPLVTKLVMLFLWINIAIFASSFNYMVWGVPFFTILVALDRKLWGLPLTPGITLLVALAFQGTYDRVGGSTGLYYWGYHLLQQPVVVFRQYPILAIAGPWLILVSEAAAVYYLILVYRSRSRSRETMPELRDTHLKLHSRTLGKSVFLTMLLLTLTFGSWAYVSVDGKFLEHHYPTVENTRFEFQGDLSLPLLDYQWVFEGNGTYSFNPSASSIILESGSNGTARLFRGWTNVIDGFHLSNNATIEFSFRLDGPCCSRNLTIAESNGGRLEAGPGPTNTDFRYFDSTTGQFLFQVPAYNGWHNVTLQYFTGARLFRLDKMQVVASHVTFSRLLLGNDKPGVPPGVGLEFSNVRVKIDDFPTGVSNAYGSLLVTLGPLALTFSFFYFATRRYTWFGRRLTEIPTRDRKPDPGDLAGIRNRGLFIDRARFREGQT